MYKKIATIATVSVLALSALAALAASARLTGLTIIIGSTTNDGAERVSASADVSSDRARSTSETLTLSMDRADAGALGGRETFYRARVPAGGLDQQTNGDLVLNQAGRDTSGIERLVITPVAGGYTVSLGDSGLNIPSADYSNVCLEMRWDVGSVTAEAVRDCGKLGPNAAGSKWDLLVVNF